MRKRSVADRLEAGTGTGIRRHVSVRDLGDERTAREAGAALG